VQYVIASNGSTTIESATRRVLDYSELSTRAAIRIPEIAAHNNVSVCMYTPLEWFVYGINHHVELEIGRSKTRPVIVKSFIDLTSPRIKAMLIGEQPNLALCESELSNEPDLEIKWFYTYPEYIDLIPQETSKGRACQQLAKRLGVGPEAIMAIGDGVNDIEMLQAANIKVAVANSSPELLSCADYVAPTNDEDGVAIAIEELVLKTGGTLSRLSRSPHLRG
jgi:Cof subfamily protein (haloacid dehalogenase superfamily)